MDKKYKKKIRFNFCNFLIFLPWKSNIIDS